MTWGIMLISVRTRDVRLGRVEHARNSFSRLGWVGQTSLTTVGNVGSRMPYSWSTVESIWIKISSSLLSKITVITWLEIDILFLIGI